MMQPGNLFSAIPAALPQELIEELVNHPHVRIERIVSKGHASPEGFWYDQPEHEWVILLQGSAILRLDEQEEPITLKPGMYINLPAHAKHRADWTEPDTETIWLAIFY